MPECCEIGPTAVKFEMLEEGRNKLFFENWHKQLAVPFIIYADFESLTTKVKGPELIATKSNMSPEDTVTRELRLWIHCGQI